MNLETHKLPSAAGAPTPARARVSLVFAWGDCLRAIPIREGQSIVVGRSAPAQVVLEDPSLSRTHARFSLRDGCVWVEDLGSTNGTRLRGQLVSEAVFGAGDLATIGAVEVQVSGGALESRADSLMLTQAAWMARLEEELARARYLGRHVSVVAVRHRDPAALAALVGSLRPIDRACVYTPTLALVMLVELESQAGLHWADALLKREGALFVLRLATFPGDAHSAESLVSLIVNSAQTSEIGGRPQRVDSTHERRDDDAVVIACESMTRLYDLVARVARTTLPVLVLGETGSGKELVARALHDRGPRARAPFKAVNCATLPSNLIESTLFGHERGAFTGADKQAAGIFEQAQGGTVFLDEVGELSAQAQAALLRVLELKRIVRLGGSKEIAVDVRVVAATHRDLAVMVAAGTFREDLMFRLDALSLRVPALRERRAEIPALAELFLARARRQWGSTARLISEDALEALVERGDN
jgi:two-component system, NtrC family, response regulator AtoC